MSQPLTRQQKSLRFLEDMQQDDPLASCCSRAIVLDQERHPLATGEVFVEPSLDQPRSGFFEPDDLTLLDALAKSSKFVMWRNDEARLILVGEVHPPDGHFHFEVVAQPA